MSWMGTAAQGLGLGVKDTFKNLGVSGGMYGVMGYMSYDSSASDPLNHYEKMTTGLLVDQVQDLGVIALGHTVKIGAAGINKMGFNMGNYGSSLMKNASKEMGALASQGKYFQSLLRAGKGGAGIFAKGLSFIGKHPVGVGFGVATAAAFFAEDLGMMAMDFYDTQEADYRRKKAHPGFHLTQSSSRFIQDQLQSIKHAGNEAEIMHN